MWAARRRTLEGMDASPPRVSSPKGAIRLAETEICKIVDKA